MLLNIRRERHVEDVMVVVMVMVGCSGCQDLSAILLFIDTEYDV